MVLRHIVALVLLVMPPALQQPAVLQHDPPKICASCDAWNARQTPFRVFGNTFYLGVGGLSAVLITSDAGSILLDGALPQSAPLIDANIRELGFRTADIRLIVTSHTHFDHVGGVAALQRASGAVVAASPAASRALQAGQPTPDDPQTGVDGAFPAVSAVRLIADGEILRVGPLAITAHFTPGHTPGGTTWTWRSCEGTRCVDVVYADSLNAVSKEGFQFTRQPGLVDTLRRSISRVSSLPCDILLSVHPEFVDIAGKLERRTKTNDAENPFIDDRACRAYATMAKRGLDRRIADERRPN